MYSVWDFLWWLEISETQQPVRTITRRICFSDTESRRQLVSYARVYYIESQLLPRQKLSLLCCVKYNKNVDKIFVGHNLSIDFSINWITL